MTSGNAAEAMKYRQSCDRCQNMKLRCSRDKPTCKRCSQRTVACIYSPLRRLGRPRKFAGEDDTAHAKDDDVEDERRGFTATVASTLSPSNSSSHGASTTSVNSYVNSQLDLAVTNMQDKDSNLPSQVQVTAPLPPPGPSSNTDDGTSRSVSEVWDSEHHLPITSYSQRVDTTTFGGNLHYASAQTDCYLAILTETSKLEQAMAQVTLAPPIDLVLEAERDFCTLRHSLLTCTGHGMPRLMPSTSPFEPNDSDDRRDQPCLKSDRPVLVYLALLADRVVGMLENMFHLAAQSAQNMDKANEVLWCGNETGPSARRLQRSFRSTLATPCVAPVVEATRDVRIHDFEVQGTAKSEAMQRILRLRVNRMLNGLRSLKGITRVRQLGERDKVGGALDWGSSAPLLGNIANTLVEDLIRRVESMQGAMVLL